MLLQILFCVLIAFLVFVWVTAIAIANVMSDKGLFTALKYKVFYLIVFLVISVMIGVLIVFGVPYIWRV